MRAADLAVLARIVRAIADGVPLAQASSIAEIEINPLRVMVDAQPDQLRRSGRRRAAPVTGAVADHGSGVVSGAPEDKAICYPGGLFPVAICMQ